MALKAVSQDFAALSHALEELSGMLRLYGEEHWAKLIEDDLHFVHLGDVYGATRFLSYFGGMGSFNDLVLCQENGHQVAPAQQQTVNERLLALRQNAWKLAEEAKCNAT